MIDRFDARQFGKLPPQAIEMEEVVIGTCMLERSAFEKVVMILKNDCFYKDSNMKIFMAMEKLYRKSDPIDILSVINTLKEMGELDAVGGPFAITELTKRVGSSANIEYQSRIVFQKFIQREIIRESSELIKKSYGDTEVDAVELLADTQGRLDKIQQMIISGSEMNFDKQVQQTLQDIEHAKDSGKLIQGLSTGFAIHDRITSGRVNGTLIIIAGRPGMGKTTLALQECVNLAITGNVPVGIFSLEAIYKQFVRKFISNMTKIHGNSVRNGRLDEDQLARVRLAAELLSKRNIYLRDIPNMHIDEMKAQARLWKKKYKIEALYLDYLQLMKGGNPSTSKSGNREQEISHISRSLKGLSMELDIPVIALSQLSRAVEGRGGEKRPQLSDLRESGSIEQDADVVEFVYRPEYYGITEDEDGKPTKGVAERIIAKNRDGALDSTFCTFTPEISRFEEIDTMNTIVTATVKPENSLNRDITKSRYKEEEPPF